MEGLQFYGAAPAYGDLYYNLHAETAWCLEELDRRFSAKSRTPIVLTSDEPVLSRKVTISTLKFRAALRRQAAIRAVWLDIFQDASIEDFWDAVLGALVDIWFGLQSINMSYFERKLISTGAFPNQSGAEFHADAVRILDQISGAEIVFVIDVRDDSASGLDFLRKVVDSLDKLQARQSNNSLAVMILGSGILARQHGNRAMGTAFVSIALTPNEITNFLVASNSIGLKEAGFSQLSSVRGDRVSASNFDASAAAISLVLVGDPILKPAVTYLNGISAERTSGMSMLADEGAIEHLRNGGVALTNLGISKYQGQHSRSSSPEPRATIEANVAHLLSASRPSKFNSLDMTTERIDKALSVRTSVIETLSACVAARIRRSKILQGYLADRLSEMLRTRKIDLADHEAPLLDDVLKYLSLIAFREPDLFDRTLFKLTEEMTYAVNTYSATFDPEGSRYLQAQRITRLARLYDNVSVEVRHRIGNADTRRYMRHALEVLGSNHDQIVSDDEYRSNYLAGWLQHDLGDADEAEKSMVKAASILHLAGASKMDGPITTIGDTSLAFELEIQALFFSDSYTGGGVRESLPKHLNAHGIVTSCEEIVRLSAPDRIGRKAIPARSISAKECWHVIFNRYDFAPAIIIASRLLFDWHRPVELVCIPDGGNARVAISECPGHKIVLGGPDSPGPIGDFIRGRFPNFSKFWQIRFNESFFQPIVLNDPRDETRTVVLTGSIAGDILHAWTKFSLKIEPLKAEKEQPMDLAMLGSVLPTILTTASKKLTELFIDRLVKSVESRLDAKNQAVAHEELADVKRILEGASNGRDADEVRRKLAQDLTAGNQSRLVQTGVMDAIENRALYRQLETVLTGLNSLEHSTNYYRDMAALLQALSLSEHHRISSNLEIAKKARNFADGFSNLRSKIDGLIEDYETKVKWDLEARNTAVNDLVATSHRFFAFIRSTY